MNIDWSILQPVDIGAHFQQGFQTGRAARDKAEMKNVLAGLASNPGDANALNALTQLNPEMGMQYRQQQNEAAFKKDEQMTKVIGNAAKMAKSSEEWDAIVGQFEASGYPDAGKLRGQFSPALRKAFMAQAGISDDEGERDLVQTDGVFFDKNTGQPVFESPYDKINIGSKGEIYRTPRIGIGRGGSGAPAAGVRVDGGLPEGWTVDEDDGGPASDAPGGFL